MGDACMHPLHYLLARNSELGTTHMLHGIIPPIVTPMQSNEDLDLPRLRKLIDLMLAKGVHGIFVLGTTSEFYALDDGEKQAVIATAVAHVNKPCPGLAGEPGGQNPHGDGHRH